MNGVIFKFSKDILRANVGDITNAKATGVAVKELLGLKGKIVASYFEQKNDIFVLQMIGEPGDYPEVDITNDYQFEECAIVVDDTMSYFESKDGTRYTIKGEPELYGISLIIDSIMVEYIKLKLRVSDISPQDINKYVFSLFGVGKASSVKIQKIEDGESKFKGYKTTLTSLSGHFPPILNGRYKEGYLKVDPRGVFIDIQGRKEYREPLVDIKVSYGAQISVSLVEALTMTGMYLSLGLTQNNIEQLGKNIKEMMCLKGKLIKAEINGSIPLSYSDTLTLFLEGDSSEYPVMLNENYPICVYEANEKEILLIDTSTFRIFTHAIVKLNHTLEDKHINSELTEEQMNFILMQVNTNEIKSQELLEAYKPINL